jgi:hypothetical protein
MFIIFLSINFCASLHTTTTLKYLFPKREKKTKIVFYYHGGLQLTFN